MARISFGPSPSRLWWLSRIRYVCGETWRTRLGQVMWYWLLRRSRWSSVVVSGSALSSPWRRLPPPSQALHLPPSPQLQCKRSCLACLLASHLASGEAAVQHQ